MYLLFCYCKTKNFNNKKIKLYLSIYVGSEN